MDVRRSLAVGALCLLGLASLGTGPQARADSLESVKAGGVINVGVFADFLRARAAHEGHRASGQEAGG